MKLIYAGLSSVYSLNPGKFLFNCTRNRACQKPYFIPVRSVKDIYLFADLPGKPELSNFAIVNACCETSGASPGEFNEDFNEDFLIEGEVNGLCLEEIVFDKYVIGLTPNNTWYGVFQTSNDFYQFRRFFFRFTFIINGEEYIYYSQMYELDPCDPLLCLRGCYPNEPIGSSSWDCNGIYYGAHTGGNKQPALGDISIRYFHNACVRKGKILDTTAKLTLSVFNNKHTFKSILEREKTLEFELVPGFYKDALLGIFARGTVEIEGVNYNLQTEQNWKVLDFNSKLWQLDTLLYEECKNFFGCKPPICEPLVVSLPCTNDLVRGPWQWEEGYFTQHFTGAFNAADSIEWEVYTINGVLVESGTITEPPLSFQVFNINPETDCFVMKWRIKCLNGYSDWKEEEFGNCNPVQQLTGTISLYSSGREDFNTGGQHCSAQGFTKFRFRFPQPTAEAITIKLAALYYPDNGSGIKMAYGEEILPVGHPDKAQFNPSRGLAFTITIPAGQTDFTTGVLKTPIPGFPNIYEALVTYPVCNPQWGANARNKFYFKVEAPVGLQMTFTPIYDTPQPFNTVPGGILTISQII